MTTDSVGGTELGELYPDIETASDDYAGRFAGEVGEFFLEVQRNALGRLLAPWQGGTVLDVGGGHAQAALYLAEAGFAVTVTGSSDSCAVRLPLSDDLPQLRFRKCDFLELPFGDKEFDAVISLRLVSHVGAWRRLLAELCRVAKEAVVIDYVDLRSFNLLAGSGFRWKKIVEGNTRPFLRLKRKDIMDHFSENRFSTVRFLPEFFLPMALHRALGSRVLTRGIEGTARRMGLTGLFGSPVIARALADDGTQK